MCRRRHRSAPQLADLDGAREFLELHERELIEEAAAPEEAVSYVREVRHEAELRQETRATELSKLDLNEVEVDATPLSSDHTANVTNVLGRREIDAEKCCEFGGEDIAV